MNTKIHNPFTVLHYDSSKKYQSGAAIIPRLWLVGVKLEDFLIVGNLFKIKIKIKKNASMLLVTQTSDYHYPTN